MNTDLTRLDTSDIEPENLWHKRLVVYYEDHVQLLEVLDLAERKLMVRKIAVSVPFESVGEAQWRKPGERLVSWIDLDKLIGVKRLQVFPRKNQ